MYTKFTAAAITDIATIPVKIEPAVAASLPTAGLTALQAFGTVYSRSREPHSDPWCRGHRRIVRNPDRPGRGRAGDRDSFREDVEYLPALGRAQVVDYKQERFEAVGKVDAVLIGGETATRSYAVVRKGGVMFRP
jgi:NADPH:quinone reductase-like Zn-dependent oxidoreductase